MTCPSLACFVKQYWKAQAGFFWDQPKPASEGQERAHEVLL